jgi:hypothetical protein
VTNQLDDLLAREQAQHHPPSMAEIFREDLGPPVFDDGPAHEPAPGSSAAFHARKVRTREQRVQQERDLAVVEQVAQDQKDDDDLDLAVLRLRHGRAVPRRALPGALRAAQRQGYGQISSAEQLAAMVRTRS